MNKTAGTPPFSAIKCLALANDLGQEIFKATGTNYAGTVEPSLANYSAGQLGAFGTLVGSGYTVLLHHDGLTRLNSWSGFGYAVISSTSVGMIIAGGFSGGYATTASNLTDTYNPGTFDVIPQIGTAVSPTAESEASDVLPVQSAEPVDLLTGAYTMDHADLTAGQQDSPRGLNFTRYYDSSRNFQNGPLGNGWRHSCQGSVTLASELDNAFGFTQPTDAASTIIGALAVTDFSNVSMSPQELLTGALAANWTVNRITNNAAIVQLGNKTYAYTGQPDGTWNPPPGSTTVLSGSNGTFALHPRLSGTVTFNSSNLINQWIDVDGNTESFSYTSGTGNLSTVTDCYGRSLTFNYYSSGVGTGLLKNVTDSTGRSVQFGYAAGSYTGANLWTVTDPDGYMNTLVSDGSNRITYWKDNSLAIITENQYDSLGRVYQQLSQGVHTWKFLYSPGETLEIDPEGHITTHLFDSENRNAGTIDALGNASSIAYDSQNHVVQSVDASGRQTTAVYDDNENLISSTDNNGKTTTYAYDSSLRPWTVTDPTGRFTKYWYDSHNHLTDAFDAGGRDTSYTYGTGGLLTQVTDPAGNETSYTSFDSYGNPTGITRGDRSTVSMTYDALGDPLTSTDGRGYTTNYTYDNRRHRASATDPYGNTTTWVYDANGNLNSVTDRNGHTVITSHNNLGHLLWTAAQDTGTVNYGYNVCDWPITVTDGAGNVTTTNYDVDGRPASVVDALSITTGSTAYDGAGRTVAAYDGLGNETQFTYDAVGRLYQTVDPLSHTQSNAYDNAGRQLSLTNRRGNTFDFVYSSDGLSGTFDYPSGRVSAIVSRDTDGRPQTLQSPSGKRVTLTYDGMNRVKTRTDGTGTVTWTYDGEGNATAVAESSGSTTRIFDKLGRVTNCEDEQNHTVVYGYDNEGNITSMTYPLSKTVTYTYDGSNRLKTVTDWAGRVTTYNYDTVGRLQTMTRPNNTRQTLTYDNANRLTSDYEQLMSGGTVVATPWWASYGYYNNGLLQSFVPTPGGANYAPPSTAMTYDADNQLQTYKGTSVSNDQDGNLGSAPVNGTVLGALTWDNRHRLTSAGGVNYTYDAENRRLTSTFNGRLTEYIFSRMGKLDKLVEKLNQDGSFTRYVYGVGLLYEETTGTDGTVTPQYYHYDWRGDTVALSDSNGNVTARMSYSPYGERTIVSGTVTTPFCFNGEWGVMRDPNGLYCMQARYYSPVLRRFLNEDPSGFGGGGNLYAYTGGDPVDAMDPFGLGPVGSSGQQLEQDTYAAQNPQYAAVLNEANAGYMATVPPDGAEQAVRGLSAAATGFGILAVSALQPEDAVLLEGAEGGVEYGLLDSLGRPTGVTATITDEMIGTGTPASQSIIPPGFQGGAAGQARGHLLGAQLGGSGSEVGNLVTLTQNPANSPVMRGFENQIRNAVEGGQVFQGSFTPIYIGNNIIPRGITIMGQGSGGFSIGVSVLNPAGL